MKTAFITGAGRGIGKEIARQLSGLGWNIILTGRNITLLEKAKEELGSNAECFVLDVNNQEECDGIAAKLHKKYKSIDVLINNAGVIGRSDLSAVNMPELKAVMETNFFGPARISAALIPLLKKSSDGRIVNISSGMGAMADLSSGYGAYRLSKWALNGLTIQLASELKAEGIRVNAICPGWVRTDMGGSSAPRSLEKGAETAVWLATSPDVVTGKFFRDMKTIPW